MRMTDWDRGGSGRSGNVGGGKLAMTAGGGADSSTTGEKLRREEVPLSGRGCAFVTPIQSGHTWVGRGSYPRMHRYMGH